MYMPQKNFKDILKSVGANEKFSRETRKPEKEFNSVRANIPMKANYNQMCDLLAVPVAEDKYKKKYPYIFVIVDLASKCFDMEPVTDKKPATILDALLKIYKRPYVKHAYGSVQSDGATEFKGIFHKWLHDKNILHKVSHPNRHSQQSMIESLLKQLGRLINGYLNAKEVETGKTQHNWLPVVSSIRKELNEYRKVDLTKEPYPNDEKFFNPPYESKYKIGDLVHNKLDWAEDALGNKQPTPNFRAGDSRFSIIPKKIIKIIAMNTKPYYRYVLESLPNVSYTERELFKADSKEKDTKYKVKKIVGRKFMNGKTHYKVWFHGELKSKASFQPENELRKDGLGDLIDAYDEEH